MYFFHIIKGRGVPGSSPPVVYLEGQAEAEEHTGARHLPTSTAIFSMSLLFVPSHHASLASRVSPLYVYH